MLKTLIFDLETSDLSADWGTLLCVGYKWYGEETITVKSLMDYKNWNKTPRALLDDSRLWSDFAKEYAKADMVVTYFGTGFDRPFFLAKLLKYNLEIPYNTHMVDLFYTVKSNMKVSRKSMDNVTRYLGLQDENVHKTPVSGAVWQLARVGDKDAMKEVIEHCRSDIGLTERLYEKIRPLVRTHPRVNGWLPCRYCGEQKLQRRGTAVTITKGKRFRFQCQSCGGWDTRSELHASQTDG